MHEVFALLAFLSLRAMMRHAVGVCALWHCSTPQTPSLLELPDASTLLAENVSPCEVPGQVEMHALMALLDCSMLLAESVCVCEVPGQPEGMMVGCKGSVTLDARFDGIA